MYASSNTLRTGPFVASQSDSRVSSAWGWGWDSNSLYYSNVGNEACSSSLIFLNMNSGINATATPSQFADYFCDGSSFVLPKEAKVIQAFTVLTTVLAFLSGILGFGIVKKGSTAAIGAGILSFLAWVFSIVAFAQASSWGYYKGLLDGSTGLLMATTGNSATGYTLVNFSQGMWWGVAFWVMVAIFVILLFTTGAFVAVSKNTHVKNDDLDGRDARKDDEGVSVTNIPI